MAPERLRALARVASALYGTVVAWVIEWAARYVVGAIDLAVMGFEARDEMTWRQVVERGGAQRDDDSFKSPAVRPGF